MYAELLVPPMLTFYSKAGRARCNPPVASKHAGLIQIVGTATVTSKMLLLLSSNCEASDDMMVILVLLLFLVAAREK